MSDADDMWRAISSLRERLGKLEQTVGEVHGEIIDTLRNRVYALEHGERYERHYDDEGDE